MKQIQPFQKHWLQITSIVVCRLNLPTLPKVLHFMVQCLFMHCSTPGWPLRKQYAQRLCKGLPTTKTYCHLLFVILCHACIFCCHISNFPVQVQVQVQNITWGTCIVALRSYFSAKGHTIIFTENHKIPASYICHKISWIRLCLVIKILLIQFMFIYPAIWRNVHYYRIFFM